MRWIEQIPNELINVRPLVFLCGPYADDNEIKDRRNILRMYFGTYEKIVTYNNNKYNITPFALIVDNLFKEDELKKIKLTLLEEIIAACAYKNYVFVDTMSTTLELGLFSNSYSQNSTTALLPTDYKLFKPSIGYFVTETMKISNNIKLHKYKNKRTNKYITKANGEQYVIENIISFRGNTVPTQIKKAIEEDFNNGYQSFLIKLEFTTDPMNYEMIFYQINHSQTIFRIPSRILLYLVNEYKNRAAIERKLFYYFQRYVESEKKELMIYCYLFKNNKIEVKLSSEFRYEIDDVIGCMNYLISALKDRVAVQQYTILKYEKINHSYYDIGMNIYDLLNFTKTEVKLLKLSSIKKSKALSFHKLVINGKNRNIVKYASNSYGFKLRELHMRINETLDRIIILNEYSYAYKKDYSVVMCVKKHIESKYFLKIDIKSFFDSISKRIINKIIKCLLCDDPMGAYEKNIVNKSSIYNSSIIRNWGGVEDILNLCFVNGKLSLGLTSSPLLSNIYMDLFDERFHAHFPELIYTRYSDDMLISSESKFDTNDVLNYIKNEFEFLKLIINNKKVHNYSLEAVGDHVKFLGLNIVKNTDKNRITIGNKYIYKVSKNIAEFINGSSNLTKSQVLGQIQYIRYISLDDYEKLLKVYKIKTLRDFDLEKFKRTMPIHL